MAKPRDTGNFADWLSNLVIQGLLAIAMARPYPRRVALMGRLMRGIVAPLAGFNRRVRANLAHVRPDLTEAEVAQICREVSDNFGRTVAEIFSGREFTAHVEATARMGGPGLETVLSRQAEGKAVILCVAHFGNYLAVREALGGSGLTMGAVYRPMDNPYFNARYVAAMHRDDQLLFPRDRAGTLALVRFIRSGGLAALGYDQFAHGGADLTFFGQSAPTTLGPAEFALKYAAPLIPVHVVRCPDGLTFDIAFDSPIEHGTAPRMMQAVNDSLERAVRGHMGQWFWVHKRWKPHRPR